MEKEKADWNGPSSRLFLSAWIISAVLAGATAMGTTFVNEDLFLSIAVGRDVAAGIIGQPDHWSFTADGRIWVNQAWLSHLPFYLAHHELGYAGPVLLKAILLTCCCLTALFHSRRMTSKWDSSLFALTFGLIGAAPFMAIRPENFGLLFFVVFLLLLTVDFKSFRIRSTAIVAVVVIWSNFHGSFMLGLMLLILKACVSSLRSLASGDPVRRTPVPGWEWWLIAASSIVGTAIISPYGLDNLTMPFRQVGTETVTGNSADWLPLFRSGMMGSCLFGTAVVYPFIIFAVCVIAASVTAVFRVGPKKLFSEASPNDALMLFLTAAVCLAAAVKFRRLILFSAFSMVPLAAIAFDLLFIVNNKNFVRNSRKTRFLKKAGFPNLSGKNFHLFRPITDLLVTLSSRLGCKSQVSKKDLTIGNHNTRIWKSSCRDMISVVLTVGIGLLFYYTAVIPHLPENPLRPGGGIVSGLMSYGSFSKNAAQFISRNNLYSRVLPGWEISSYLMFCEPRIKLFMDVRDQSFYPVTVVRDYFTVLGVVHSDAAQAVGILDRYGVETVVLSTNLIDFDAGVRLLGSRKWKSLYADTESMVLVRSDNPILDERDSNLWFPDADSRILSACLNSYFDKGAIGTENTDRLKKAALVRPWPNYYALIFGAQGKNRCERGPVLNYLLSEAQRLDTLCSGKKYPDPVVIESLAVIHEILGSNAAACGDGNYAELLLGSASELRKEYDRKQRALSGKTLCLE